ncbi:type II secretion system F family protein [Microbacterium sp. YY-03]|uniref:type II secretion system F family protein n=1 Tax=Microbacterium sp. YY-03 TaxID=3421636 RepID=UPI003D162738
MRPNDTADVAATTLRIAVLLESGAIPERVFSYIAEACDDDDPMGALARRINGRIRDGIAVADAVETEAGSWQWVASAWRIAKAVGAPVSPALRSIVAVANDAREAADDVRIALAEPASTARLMMWLPALSVLMGVALGFNSAAILVTNPIGVACLVLGVSLILIARWWTRRIVAAAAPSTMVPGLRAELLSIALAGGASPTRAQQLVDDVDLGDADGDDDTAHILRLSAIAGVPAADLLRASAAAIVARARTAGRLRATRLATRLLLPLGACTLPAFFLLGVAPMMLSVITSTEVPL